MVSQERAASVAEQEKEIGTIESKTNAGNTLETATTPPTTETSKRLLSFITRIENLEQEKAIIAEDVKDIYVELKAVGFCPKTTKKVVKLRAMDEEKRSEEQALLETYANAIQLKLF